MTTTTKTTYHVGDKVIYNAGGGEAFPATVTEITLDAIFILFDDEYSAHSVGYSIEWAEYRFTLANPYDLELLT